MRITFIESTDVRAAYDALAAGDAETYQGQTYSVGVVQQLAEVAENVTVIATKVPDAYEDHRAGVDLKAFEYWSNEGRQRLQQALDAAKPDRIVLRTPIQQAIDWATANDARVLAMFADSFSAGGFSPRAIRARWRHKRLASALNGEAVDLVCNHNRAATNDLVRIGVRKEKTLPWEWPTPRTPADFMPKPAQPEPPYSLLYVGALVQTKGVGDLIDMMALGGPVLDRCRLTLIGSGADEQVLKAKAAHSPAADRIHFAGTLPNTAVFERMAAATLVMVPSHHAYAEGLPKTIREALTVRTPVVITDHPAFQGYFSGASGTMMVPEKSPAALADAVATLLASDEAYAAASDATLDGFNQIDCPHKWGDVIEHWLMDDPSGYLSSHAGRW